ncbi:MAG: hypothetical protein H6834_15565 [Planctomycetes bacterium]|nr:hypothetical protein [Planctomycetota bacterium]
MLQRPFRRGLPTPAATPWIALTLAALSFGQEPIHTTPTGDSTGGASFVAKFEIPIHEEIQDETTTPELWASREPYKVSFHDGIAFYPVLGTSYPRNLPLTWRTSSIRVGSHDLFAAGDCVEARSTAWRHELHRGAVVEAYDVLPAGLEQTFVITTPLPATGNLVIRGSITTELEAPRCLEPRHGSLTFVDGTGTPIVEYGAGAVIDANGDPHPVRTAFDGEHLSLHVDAAWLACAAYPITVDPLLSSQILLNATDDSRNPGIARSAGSFLLVTESRAVSASDFDTMGVRTSTAFSAATLIFAVNSASISNPHTRAAYVRHADRWCIAMESRAAVGPISVNAIGWHLRRPGDGAFRSVSNHTIVGTQDSRPEVGGDDGGILPGDNALIVFQRGTSSTSSIRGAVIDCVNESLLVTSVLSDPAAVRCQFPSVVKQVEMRLDPWVVTWQEEGAATRRQLRMTWVFNDGDTSFVYPLGTQTDLTRHNFKPRIDGRSGTYSVAFLRQSIGGTIPSDPVGPEIWIDSFRLNHIVGQNVSVRHVALERIRSGINITPDDIAFDVETQSHWTVASEARFFTGAHLVDRIGFDGRPIESTSVSMGFGGIAVTYQPRTDAYPIVYSAGTQLLGRDFTYPAIPASVEYGRSCGFGRLNGDTGAHETRPYAGHERFELTFGPVQQQIDLGVLLLGAQSLDVPLNATCSLNVDPLVTLPFSTSGTQSLAFRFALPSDVQGQLFAQVMYVTRSSGEFGATNGYRFEIVR